MSKLQSIVEEILDAECPVESLLRDDIKDLYRNGYDFQTPQVFCVFLVDDQFSRTAVFGSSATANDDGLPHPLALVINNQFIQPLRITAHTESIIETLGLEVG